MKSQNKAKATCAEAVEQNTAEVITAEQLTKEISLLLKDYFVATVNSNSDVIILKFFNGQNFKIIVEQC